MNTPIDINIYEIVTEIAQELRDHIIFEDDAAADALALWTLGTYFIDQLDIFPFVFITSPEAQCGKSTTLRMLSAFVKNSRQASKITPAALYRVIERDQPTLLLDEADRFVRNNSELIGILNAGHTRFDAYVIINRKQPDGNWEPADFSVWCAKAIAGIGDQDDTISSRSLVISLRRKLSTEIVKRLTYDYVQNNQCKRNALEQWASQIDLRNYASLEFLGASDRGFDNWRPLGQLANAIGFEWPDRLQKGFAAIELKRVKTEDDTTIEFLTDLREVLGNCAGTEIQSSELLNFLLRKEDSDWFVHNHGRPITQ